MVIKRPVKSQKPKRVETSATKPSSRASHISTLIEDETSKAKSAAITGEAGFAIANRQQKRQQEEYERRREKPFAFRITQGDISKGNNTVELLYLDQQPFFVRLHTIKNPRGGFDDEVCIADTGEICPLCKMLGKEGTYTLMLTALDKRPYRNREGQLVKLSKKLIPIKSRNIAKFERQWKKHGTFRGLVAIHRRHGAKEASIGEDIEFKDRLVSEETIQKLVRGKQELLSPPDYFKIFPTPTAQELIERYGGNKLLAEQSGGFDDEEDGINWG
jgi:hypothetical protein